VTIKVFTNCFVHDFHVWVKLPKNNYLKYDKINQSIIEKCNFMIWNSQRNFKLKIYWFGALWRRLKGLAHAGVLKFLEEININPKAISSAQAL
jgi:hypothetical protein